MIPGKRGDVPTGLILPVAIILMLLAIYSFLTVSGKLENNSKDISQIITEVNFYEKYVRNIGTEMFIMTIDSGNPDLKGMYMKIAKERDMRIAEAGNFFGKIRTGDFKIYQEEGRFVLEVEGLFVRSENKENKHVRNFDIKKELFLEKKAKPEEKKPKSGECRVHASGDQVADYYSAPHEKEAGFASSLFWVEDQFSDIIGPGEYRLAGEAFPKASEARFHTFDSMAISKGTKVTFYSKRDFQGEVLFEGTGPLVVYNMYTKPNGINQLGENILKREFKEPYQSEFPPETRVLSKSNMHLWSKSWYYGKEGYWEWVGLINGAQEYKYRELRYTAGDGKWEYAGGSVKIECLLSKTGNT